MNEIRVQSSERKILTKIKDILREKIFPVPHCTSKMPKLLAWF
jgi:hypothetical protein